MKTNFYILLILLLSFSVANAQEDSKEVKVVTVNEITVNNSVSENANEVSTSLNNESQSVEVIAGNSDIRIYLNQIRNVQNIHLLFPKFKIEELA